MTRLIVAADILGVTAELQNWGQRLPGELIFLSPYGQASPAFDHEDAAYEYFCREVGHDLYHERLKETVAQNPGAIIVGFSAGATALWRTAISAAGPHILLGIGFYGSRIHPYAEAQARCPLELIFPAEEPSFSVPRLIEVLAPQPLVKVQTRPWSHGYMNPLSPAWDPAAAESETEQLADRLRDAMNGGRSGG